MDDAETLRTELEAAQRELARLRHDRDRWRKALEDALYGYDVVDAEGRFVYANAAYLRMWGYASLDELVGTSPVAHCVDPETPARLIGAALRDGHTTQEFQARRKDGSTFDVLMAIQTSTADDGSTVFVGTSLDVSELSHLRNELHQLQKVEALGGLAAGVAHDFNNLLVPIQGYVDLAIEDPRLPEDLRAHLEQIQIAGARAADLTAQLLAISRKQILAPRPTDLNEAAREAGRLLQRVLRANIRLTIDTAAEPCRVVVDPSQLQQVLLNLMSNAQDAMPNGGDLRLGVRDCELSAADCRARVGGRPGRYGEVVVADSGTGIDAATLRQVFEPFFSTKGRSGTGLGLATVRGIVEQHQGHVWVDTQPGAGTTFRVYLPLTTDAEGPPLQEAPREAAVASARPAQILVVEDDEMVRTLTRTILEHAGYAVATAHDGASARAWLADCDGALDLLLCDVVLPDLRGPELAEAVVGRHPQARVLFMSGYTDDALGADGQLAPGVDLLEKPFAARELRARVEQALGRSPQG